MFDFVKRYNDYHDSRERISDTLFNRTLVITKEQYEKIAEMVNHYDRRFVGDQVMIAIPEDEATKRIVAILDALGM